MNPGACSFLEHNLYIEHAQALDFTGNVAFQNIPTLEQKYAAIPRSWAIVWK